MATREEAKNWFNHCNIGDSFKWLKDSNTVLTVICTQDMSQSGYKTFDFGIGNRRVWVVPLATFFSYASNMVFSDPSKDEKPNLSPIIRRTRELERRFKAKQNPKTKMKPLPFPKGVPT